MKVVRSLEEKIWRDFIDSHPESNVFHTPEMFQVFARAKNHRPTLWAVTDDDERVLALLLPVRITLIERLRRLTTRAVAYGSVLYAQEPKGREALALLLRAYTQEVDGAPLFTELRNLADLSDVQPILRECNFVYEDHLNYLISLQQPPEVVLQNIGPRTRKHIRRGLRRGEVAIEEAREREQVVACYDLLRQSYQRARIPLADRSLFEAAFDLLYPKGMVRFTLACVGQVPVAASVELLYKDVIYGWYGGVDRSYGSYVPNELLLWHILQWGSENGYRTYDFGGAGRTDEEYGVRDFKAKFGGKLVCYGRNTYVHRPTLLRLSQYGYEVYRRFL
jgi:CelD/BcsL family acetyltransferase involved in cellulose biosynthesis